MSAPAMANRPLAAVPGRDPLAEARDLLRRAARLPYHVAHAENWARRFSALSRDAGRAIAAHVLRYERDDSPVSPLPERAPHLLPALQREGHDHVDLMRRSVELVHEADNLDQPDIWTMVELGEQAMLLAQAVERHHGRLLDLVYEADCRDLGGGG